MKTILYNFDKLVNRLINRIIAGLNASLTDKKA